jgi:hypothetical protein
MERCDACQYFAEKCIELARTHWDVVQIALWSGKGDGCVRGGATLQFVYEQRDDCGRRRGV